MEVVYKTLRRARRQWQGPKAVLRERLRQTAHSVEARLRQMAHGAAAHNAWSSASEQVSKADWMTLVRPTLWDERTAMRRVAEPVVALVAASALAAMGSLAVANLVGFIFACLMAIAILTQVFGLSLDIDTPGPKTP